jgi:2-methylcitrate dehydratase
MGYCLACALLDGDVTRASFRDEKIRDPKVLALLDRIRIVETPECNAGYPEGIPNRLIVKLRDGRTLDKRIDFPRGHAGNPMTDDEVVAKFSRLADGVISRATADRIVNQCMALESMTDVSALMEFETV